MGAARYSVVEVSDSKSFCQCCGKTGLKRVVFIADSETGEVRHFGSTCATSPAKGFGLDAEVKAVLDGFVRREAGLNSAAGYAYRREGGKYANDASNKRVPVNMARWFEIREQISLASKI
ncbi:hypothetical protein [Rhodoferax antarcticus]|uniref:Uncharacterized protein n=1 Tax=Rhodoferax antarcticus ANT.BR TaxID=1111071 RepID=A0A1Q8Y987_9BURK|nr:hypothetical protein [Rhodoferax antarcticus]OLP04563.1 hypothetical protein BLL52_4141 [Rhodoferax antarcticus ANT.BR]